MLKLAFSRGTRRHMWASFSFGILTGIMRSVGPLPNNTGDTVSFVWRGYEQGEDTMTYKDHNTATITFMGDGKLKGVIEGSFLEPNCKFAGLHVERQNTVWCMYVKQWKATYRGINDRSYERANVGRWGKWVSDEGCQGKADDSDTTAAGLDSEAEDYESENDRSDAYLDGRRGYKSAEADTDKCRRLEKELAAAQKMIRAKDREIARLKSRLDELEEGDGENYCMDVDSFGGATGTRAWNGNWAF